MNAFLRFFMTLALVLGLLIYGAWFIISDTTGRWFEKDVGLRAQLAVNGAQRSLVSDLRSGDARALERLLEDIARDERIMGAALCGPDDMRTIASTRGFPEDFGCRSLERALLARGPLDIAPGFVWRLKSNLAGGPVQINAIALADGGRVVGVALLAHDLAFAATREASTGAFLLGALGVLAVLASAATLLVVRLCWRNWNRVLHRMARGQEPPQRREFLPVIKDLRELLDRLAAEEQAELHGSTWTPDRLKLTLRRHLHGERLVVVANREPYIHERGPDGAIRVLHPASGLVSALEPVLRACSGVWVAHGAGSADRETSDRHGRVRVPPGEESYMVRRIWLSEEEEKGYYYGFANEGLWPLCHVSHTRPIFRAEDWDQYRKVNERFVRAVCEEVDSDDPVILVQDYHFALAPRMLRERLPRATILTFWHIPWPNPEQISICPWHRELIEGMLGSSILGFHTQFHCNNFMEAADRFLESRLDREDPAVIQGRRRTLVRSYPISIQWPHHWASEAPGVEDSRRIVFEELGLPPERKLGIGVDRLDYTKGIEERLRAVEKLLERQPALHGQFTFLQIASPSRSEIDRYAQLSRDVEALAARINARFSRPGWEPIILRRRHTEPLDVFRYFRAADVCYVSSLHDGMNLVAKEFVAARDDEQGVLVLSQFAGAARELTEALIVNPYDIEQAARALEMAVTMSPAEQRARMSAMRKFVAEFNVYRWAGRMLLDASRLRGREQLASLLSDDELRSERRKVA